MSVYFREIGGELREVTPATAQAFASGHIRYWPMEVLCGVCGGIGCEHCAEPEPEPRSRWARLRSRLGSGGT